MDKIRVTSLESLRQAISALPPGTLYRGQTRHYEKEGRPSIGTSFDRHGCIPPEMIKWSAYARRILRSILGVSDVSLEFTHAILQHYGWRSWYVDCTMNPAVAAWFACHRYHEDRSGGIFEDYNEQPVHLRYRFARYEFEAGEAHLYALDPAVAARQCGLTDLSAISIPNATSRAQAQSAWLLGPLQNRVIPEEAFLAHFSGPREIFREFAKEAALVETVDLFPSAEEDPILDVFLSLPWRKVGDLGGANSSFPVCDRSLSLPEYQRLHFKIANSRIAFYTGASIRESSNDEGTVIPVNENVLYGSVEPGIPARFTNVMSLVRVHGMIFFECPELLRHPHMLYNSTYQKGVAVVAQPGGLVALGELVVEHPGLDLVSFGIARPWFYRVDDNDLWSRESHPDECDCNDPECHERHLESLKIVESLLS